MRTILLTLILLAFGIQASADEPHWSQGGEMCADLKVSTTLFEMHFELEQSGKCLYMKTRRHHAYILHDVLPHQIQEFQTNNPTFPFESFKLCNDTMNPYFVGEIKYDLLKAGVVRNRNILFSNLAYWISQGLSSQGIYQNGVYYYSTPYRKRCMRMDRTEAGSLEVLTDRTWYPEETKQEYWRHMELYWSLLEVFEKYGQRLDEYSFVPEEMESPSAFPIQPQQPDDFSDLEEYLRQIQDN